MSADKTRASMLAVHTNFRIKSGEQRRELLREQAFWNTLEKAWTPVADKYPTLGEFIKSPECKQAQQSHNNNIGRTDATGGDRANMNP